MVVRMFFLVDSFLCHGSDWFGREVRGKRYASVRNVCKCTAVKLCEFVSRVDGHTYN
jgi:hypothetical protein